MSATFFKNCSKKSEDGGLKASRKAYNSEVKKQERAAKKNDRGEGAPKRENVRPERQLQETFNHCEQSLANKEAKRNARVQYAQRHKYDLPSGYKTLDEISPYLDNIRTPEMTDGERIKAYSTRHKCKHGKAFTKICLIKKDQRIHRFYAVGCDHENDSIEGEAAICPRCQSARATTVVRMCGHKGIYCRRCSYTSYWLGGWTCESCNCNTPLSYEMKEAELGHTVRTPFNGEFVYDHTLLQTSIKRFLDDHVVTKIKHVTTEKTYAGVVKKKTGIREYLAKALTEEKTMIPEGAMASSMYQSAAGGISSAVDSITKMLSGFSESIFKFLEETVMAKKNLEGFLEVLTIIGSIMEAIVDWINSRSMTEVVLLFTALLGSDTQQMIALATMVVGIAGTYMNTVHRLSCNWKGRLGAVLTSTVETFPSRVAALLCLNKKDLQDSVKALASYAEQFGITDYERMKKHPAYVLLSKEFSDQEITNMIDTCKRNKFRMEPESVSDVLTLIVSAFAPGVHVGLFKSLSMFCKEILPIIMVSKNIAQLGTKIWDWLKKMLGFCTTDTKTWVQIELQTATSPVRIGVFAALDYKIKAGADLPDSRSSMVEAKTALEKMVAYIKEEQRLDSFTMKLISDTERIISSTTCPPSARKGEPFCVRLYGPPGTGKSRTAPYLFAPILGAKTQEEFYAKTFMRNMQEYWDGVGTRQCIMYDDFGQNRAEPMDLMELILLVSAAPFMANFANITGSTPKGMSIDPKVVIACSNVENDYTTQISDVGAIYRRFHLRIQTKLGDNGETKFSVRGGAITGEAQNGGRRLTPTTDWLSMKEMREYIYQAYNIFLYDRMDGRQKIDESFDSDFPCPLEFDTTGSATTNPTLSLKEAQSNILKFAKNKLDAPSNMGLPEPRMEGGKTMIPQYSMSFGELFDSFLMDASMSYLVWLVGVNVCTSYQFVKHMDFSPDSFMGRYKALVMPAAVALCTSLIGYMMLRSSNGMEPESSISKNKAHAKQYVPEGGVNDPSVWAVQNVLQKATCILTRVEKTGKTYSTNAMLVGGMYLLTVEHVFVPGGVDSGPTMEDGKYLSHVKDGTKFFLKVPTIANSLEFLFEKSRMTVLEKFDEDLKTKVPVDCVLYELPRIIPMQKHIFSRFWNGDFSLSEKKGLLLEYNIQTQMQTWRETRFLKSDVLFHDQNGRKWRQNIVYATHGSHPGACGAPVMLSDGTSNSPVVGIHIGYYHEMNYACVLTLTKSMIETIVKKTMDTSNLNSQFTRPIDGTMQPEMTETLLEGTDLQLVGRTTRKMFDPTKTTLRKSLVFDKIQVHTTEPSVLSNDDPRIPGDLKGKVDLFKDGVGKMKRQIRISYEDLNEVRDEMKEWYLHLNDKNFGVKKRPMSLYQTLNPSNILKSIDMTTSPGFPFTLRGVKRTDLFVRYPDGLRLTPIFLQQLLEDLKEIKEGKVPQWFVVGSLKDERRPIEKIRVKPKTRLFTVCPIVQILLEKRYFSRFMELVLLERKVPYAGGVDRLGKSWHDMFMQLREVSDVGFGGDYECYDGSVSEGLLRSASEIMMQVLDEGSLKNFFFVGSTETDESFEALRLTQEINSLAIPESCILEAVRLQLSNPTYIIKNRIFRASGSLTSGCWTTQVAGSLANEMLLRYGWNDLVPAHIRGGYHFSKFVRTKIMGDDNINAVERTASKWFNAETYAQWLDKKGMVYTSADKKGKAIAIEPLSDISFLKNKTGNYYGYYAPQMEVTAALEPINWVRESKYVTPLSALEMNSNGSLRALFFHGRSMFDALRKQLLKEQPDLALVDFNTLHHQYMNYGTFPGTQPEEMAFYEQMNVVPMEPIRYDTTGMAEPLQDNAIGNTPNEAGPSNLTKMSGEENNEQHEKEQQEEPEKKMEPQMFQSKATKKWCCSICPNEQQFVSMNRCLDHMWVEHQGDDYHRGMRLHEVFQHMTIKTIREVYTEMGGQRPVTDRGRMLKEKMLQEGYRENEVLSALNNMISYVNSSIDKRTLTNTNQTDKLTHQVLYYGKDEDIAKLPKKKIDLDKLVEVMRLAEEEGYEIIPERSRKMTPEMSESVVSSFPLAGEGAVTIVDTPVPLEEVPIVTSPDVSKSIKDPTGEARTTQNQEGTTLSDKSLIDHVTVRASPFVSPRAESTLNDQAWNIEKMLMKWHAIEDVAWTVSDARETILFQEDLILGIIKSAFAGAPFSVFKDFRCAGVRIKAVMVASKWHQGRVCVGVSPSMVPLVTGVYPRVPSSKDLIEIGCIKLDPSQGGTTELYVPFRHPKSYLTLEEKDSLGQLAVIVHSPLKVVNAASQSVVVKLFFCLDSPVFKVPKANALTFTEIQAIQKKFAEVEFKAEPKAQAQRPKRMEPQMAENKQRSDKSQQPSINEYPREGIHIAAKRAMTGDPKVSHFGEAEFNLVNIGKKYHKVGTYTNSTAADGVIWWKLELADILRSFWVLDMFNALRGAVNFKILHSVGGFQSAVPFIALVEAFFEPQPDHPDAKYQAAFSTDFDPHRVMQTSNNGALEFQIPFQQRSAIALNPKWYKPAVQSTYGYLPRGTLWIRVGCLSTPGGTARFLHNLDVYASLADEFTMGVFRGVPYIKIDTGFPGWLNSRHPPIEEEKKEEKKMRPEMIEELIGGAIKTIADKVVPEKVLSTALQLLDKPAISTMPSFVTSKKSGFMNFADGPEPLDKMTLHPARQQISDPEHYGVKFNEASMPSLFTRASHLGYFEWKVGNQSGDLLASFNVGPTVDFELGPAPFCPTIMCYLASKFKYWRGGITFIFEVVGTNFHEGRLDFTYHPNSGIIPANYETRVSQYTVSCAVKNTENKFAITCPYLGEEPFRRVNTGQPSNEADATATPPSYSEFYNGALGVSVGAPLRVPDGVPDSVFVEIYVLPANDFQFQEITMDGRSMITDGQV